MTTFPIIDKLGGRDAALDKLKAIGFEATRDQMRMWETRRRLPGDAQLALMRLADREKIEYGADDFAASESASAAE
jgi:hypothetical protein